MQHLKRLMGYINRYRFLFILGTILTILSIGLEGIKPYLTRLIVDEGLENRNFESLTIWIGILLGVAFLRSLIWYARAYTFHFMTQKTLYDFRIELYDKLQAQSFAFYDKVRTGILMNRMVGDLEAIRKFLTIGYAQFIECIVLFIVAFSLMLSMSVKLTIVTAIIMPFMYINTVKLANALQPIYKSVRKAFENLTSQVEENITGIRVVKAFGNEKSEQTKFYHTAKKFTAENIKAADMQAKYAPFSEFINGIGLIIVLLVGGYLVIQQEITIGVLVAFNAYINMLRGPIRNLNSVINHWENATASLEKVYDVLDTQPAIQDKKNALVLDDIQGDVRFKKVFFKYGKEEVLHNININMKAGTVTAIMGTAGSGKTTIINLLGRFYDCTAGEIYIDGYNIKELKMNSFRSHIGIILQETFLFTDNIANNIAFGNLKATKAEIERAARIADAHDFIMEMPKGYDTVIGERGVGLSGGQRQRIAIARAIVCDPAILVLDDATSSVDMETEHEIQTTLRQVMENRTTLIIAHRISSVKDADQIIYLQDGYIVERGTHADLMALRGRYYDTFEQQYGEKVIA